MTKVVLNCGAWGEPYISNYINHIYPNHLAGLDKIADVDYEYYFYTSVEDLPKIQTSLHLKLNGYYSSKVVAAPLQEYSTNGHPRMKIIIVPTPYHIENMEADIIQRSSILGASLFLLAGDGLYPSDSFSNILKLAETTDKKVFLTTAYRVTTDIYDCLKDGNYSARNLVKQSLKCIHSKSLRHCADDDIYKVNLVLTKGYIPTLFYWKFKDTGLIVRTFHMTPIFFKKSPTNMRNAIDQGTYLSTNYSRDDLYIIDDSDTAICIDVDTTPFEPLPLLGTDLHLDGSAYGNTFIPKPGVNLTPPEIRIWAKGWTHRNLREQMKHNVYIHSDDLNDEWLPLKQKVDAFITETFGDLLDCKDLF